MKSGINHQLMQDSFHPIRYLYSPVIREAASPVASGDPLLPDRKFQDISSGKPLQNELENHHAMNGTTMDNHHFS